MTCILVMLKNVHQTNWIVSARGDCDDLRKLKCYEDPPMEEYPKNEYPAIFVADVQIPNCRNVNSKPEDGKIYRLLND